MWLKPSSRVTVIYFTQELTLCCCWLPEGSPLTIETTGEVRKDLLLGSLLLHASVSPFPSPPPAALSLSSPHLADPLPDDKDDPEPPKGWSWMQLIPGVLIGILYYMASDSDPIPSVSFSFFLQHMLFTGQVQ